MPLRFSGVQSFPTRRDWGPSRQSEHGVWGGLQPSRLLPVVVWRPVLALRPRVEPGADQPDCWELHLPGFRARLPIYQPDKSGETERTTKDHCQTGNAVQVRFIFFLGLRCKYFSLSTVAPGRRFMSFVKPSLCQLPSLFPGHLMGLLWSLCSQPTPSLRLNMELLWGTVQFINLSLAITLTLLINVLNQMKIAYWTVGLGVLWS